MQAMHFFHSTDTTLTVYGNNLSNRVKILFSNWILRKEKRIFSHLELLLQLPIYFAVPIVMKKEPTALEFGVVPHSVCQF